MESVWDAISSGLGLGAAKLSFWQMGLRAATIYVAIIVMIRVGGDRRFLGKHAAMDVLLTVILGSTLSRAINGGAPFFKTLAAAMALVGLHRLFAAIAFHFPRFDNLLKGHSRILIRDGQVRQKTLRQSHLTHADLEAALRLKAKLEDPQQVKLARLESSGEISVMPQEKPTQVVEVTVEDGVKTLRIQLD
ncbi:MAG: DUF421 domain-containing protein [Oscillatoria sp. PMC 1068.18]|nr:DUF421 domain-containing protein [Oscillatoria sp. PMC 1076.18]MEC4990674.1 DUF421 domain-containing protein [Oscillatoria sp. PMC 1068.18]